MPSSQSSHQWELSSEYGGTHDPGQLSGVLAWTVLTGPLHTQHLHTHVNAQIIWQPNPSIDAALNETVLQIHFWLCNLCHVRALQGSKNHTTVVCVTVQQHTIYFCSHLHLVHPLEIFTLLASFLKPNLRTKFLVVTHCRHTGTTTRLCKLKTVVMETTIKGHGPSWNPKCFIFMDTVGHWTSACVHCLCLIKSPRGHVSLFCNRPGQTDMNWEGSRNVTSEEQNIKTVFKRIVDDVRKLEPTPASV